MIGWDISRWYFDSPKDWFTVWGLGYPGVWIFVIFWIFAFGACIGSFLNVCIWRIPRGESLSKASSHCTVCGNPIRWFDNIPVLSYLVLRGRCRACRTPYSSSYFWVELICGLLTAMVVVKTGLTEQLPGVIPARILMIFFGISCAMTDIRFRVVPDKLTYSGMFFALIAACFFPETQMAANGWYSLLNTLASGVIPAVLLAVFAEVCRLFCSREVIGYGDVKFVALCGMLLGLPGAFFALLTGSVAGSLWGLAVKRRMDASLPFVPFITLGAWIWIFCDRQILDVFKMIYW